MSPVFIRQLTPNGLQPVSYSAESLSEATKYEPDQGVYTVANTVNTYDVLKLSAHLSRLADSAKREGIAFTLSPENIRNALRELIDTAGYRDVKFRITVPAEAPNQPILSVEPFSGYPAEMYTQGIHVVTAPNSARHNAAAKDTAWMHQRERLQAQMVDQVREVILLDDKGKLLEGTSSNFYAIQDDTLFTAGEGILGGTSRQIVMAVAPELVPIVEQAVDITQIAGLSEAFITSSSRGVVPVVKIDGTVLGDGKPGDCTLQIREAYLAWVAKHLETL